jgi:hypothetical protein
MTAIVIHFTFYYGKITVPFTKSTGENPGVAGAMAIVCSVLLGILIFYILSKRKVKVVSGKT